MKSSNMYALIQSGYTYQSVADMCQMSKQNVHTRVMAYKKKVEKGKRGRKLNIDKIIFKGIYEHFKNNPYESLNSFGYKLYGCDNSIAPTKILNFITGKNHSFFNIPQVKRICEICGTSFEETFAERRDT